MEKTDLATYNTLPGVPLSQFLQKTMLDTRREAVGPLIFLLVVEV